MEDKLTHLKAKLSQWDAEESLYQAILSLKNSEEMKTFLKDLCTPQEISVMTERWKVCQLLERGDLSYREINAVTGASLTTIGRVARFIKDEKNRGYQIALSRIKKEDRL